LAEAPSRRSRGGEVSFDLREHSRLYTASWLARIDVAIEALTAEIFRPPKSSWTNSNAQHVSRRSQHPRRTVRKAIRR
jgi:hypothetical protein